jgi:hypothetical protein
MEGEELSNLYESAREATELLEMAERLEALSKCTPIWHAATRARVEARATLEQAEELRRALEELGKRLGG